MFNTQMQGNEAPDIFKVCLTQLILKLDILLPHSLENINLQMAAYNLAAIQFKSSVRMFKSDIKFLLVSFVKPESSPVFPPSLNGNLARDLKSN